MASMIAQRAMGVQVRPAVRAAPRAIPALKAMPLKPAAKQVSARKVFEGLVVGTPHCCASTPSY